MGSCTVFGEPVLREAVGAQAVGSPLAQTYRCCCQLLWLCGIHSSAHTARVGVVTGKDLQKKFHYRHLLIFTHTPGNPSLSPAISL